MTTLTPLIAVASGSVGNVVHSHNQYGPYTRPRTIPTDPNTGRQQRHRAKWANAAWRWSASLTPAQRRAWRTYADNIRRRNRIGTANQVSAFAMFMRLNVSRLVPPLGWIDTPPATFGASLWTRPIADTFGTVGFVGVTIDPADAWANENLGAMMIFVSAVRGSAVNFFKGPFRRLAVIRGYLGNPPPALRFYSDPWGTTTGARRWARSYVVRADGRLSDSAILPFADNV